MAGNAKEVTLILHIGLHKTATTYIQSELSLRRHDLLEDGILHPIAGQEIRLISRTREGAQSGHAMFTRPKTAAQYLPDLLREIPESASTVLLSSEDFTLPATGGAAGHLRVFEDFGQIKVVLVLRRQDEWIQSFYKQSVDQYRPFETRPFAKFLEEEGPHLLDFHARFNPWREAVGSDNFHVLSYDDDGGGSELCRRILQIGGASPEVLARIGSAEVERYDSVRSIDTVGLRVLNACRLSDRDERVRLARAIYDVAPGRDIALMSDEMREGVQKACAPINQRIEAEWFDRDVPGFRFASPVQPPPAEAPSGEEMLRYLDDVLQICASASREDAP